jgi:hypothetical protein
MSRPPEPQPWVHPRNPVFGQDVRSDVAGQAPVERPRARYPLYVSADRRRLLDADGRPFLVQGDAAWSLIANLTEDEAIDYLDDRRSRGFNALIVSLVEHLFSADPPRDRAGNPPFLEPPDMSTVNDAYFDHAERVLEACETRGIAVILAPAYLGYRQTAAVGASPHAEGWYEEVVGTGPDGCRRYGTYLGRRFGRFANVIWCLGGDWQPDAARAGLDALAAGLREAGAQGLFTAHVRPETSPVDAFAGSDWLDLNLTYTYGIVHRALRADWEREPRWAYLLVESTYEGEHNASELQIRRQAWWSVLCGGNGHCMGNNPIWLFWDGWREALDLPASRAMTIWGDVFRALPWWELEPDLDERLVIDGAGEARGLDRATAALTPDGHLAVTYIPSRRPITLDLDVLSGAEVRVAWVDPASGRRRDGGILRRQGQATLVAPFPDDAALVLETVRRSRSGSRASPSRRAGAAAARRP